MGKREADSLRGGNYNRDVVKKGFVHKVGSIGADAIYALTEKGLVEANMIVDKLKKKR
ncbi:MAG: hypothetical protein JRN68_10565 [Nitrososphaerota archaeon]|nr:hypothetical protein [Nitrososphaerota archaeon]